MTSKTMGFMSDDFTEGKLSLFIFFMLSMIVAYRGAETLRNKVLNNICVMNTRGTHLRYFESRHYSAFSCLHGCCMVVS